MLSIYNCIGILAWSLDRLAIYLPSSTLSVLLGVVAMLDMWDNLYQS